MSYKKVTIFNKKGGVGKTSLAFSIAKDLNYALLSNDDSVIEEIYPSKAKIIEDDNFPILDHDTVNDLGGFINSGIIEIFKNSSIVIVPTFVDVNSIKRTINTVMEVNKYCENILIILNAVESKTISKYKNSIELLKGLDKPMLQLRKSEIVNNSIYTGKTITELYNKDGLSKNAYKNIYAEYQEILKYIKEN